MNRAGASSNPPTETPLTVLVGVPGAGKSTVGRLLAEAVGAAFRDTDDDIAAAEGSPVSEIILDRGEEVFRALEREAVLRALSGFSGVLALGGGAVLDDDVRAAVAASPAPVVWLQASAPIAAARVGMNVVRPVMLGNVRAQLAAMLAARAPLYAEIAEVVVSTDHREPAELVDEIIAGLGITDEDQRAPVIHRAGDRVQAPDESPSADRTHPTEGH